MSLGIGGLQIKRLADCVTEINQLFEDRYGISNMDQDNAGPYIQFVGVLGERESALWELIELLVLALSETGARGVLLDQLYLLVNMIRLPARKTRTIDSDAVTPTERLAGVPGTIVPIGFELKTSDTGVSFFSESEATIGAGGTVDVSFAAGEYGPVTCLAGTLTVIVSPLTGLVSATNLQDAQVGRLQETDSEFRTRRQRSAAAVLSASAPGVLASVLTVAGVLEVKEIENRHATPDIDGRPPNSYELVVRGGEDLVILTKVLATKPAGIKIIGNVTGEIVDLHGDGQPSAFSRPTGVPIYIDVDIEVDAAFPANGETAIRDTILAYGQSDLTIGYGVAPWKIEQRIETPGIQTLAMRVGTVANPAGTIPVPIGATSIAEIDSTRIRVRRTN